jgi:predicted DsbA family dithiol-disulfide isomerase
MAVQLRSFAEGFGITGMAERDRIPSTRKALALAEHARDRGRLHPLRTAVMEAHWRRGEDIEDPAVLAACARAAGLEPDRALAALAEPGILARVDAMGAEAHRAGVTGIPTLMVGERRVVGCQPYAVIAAAAEAGGARRRG